MRQLTFIAPGRFEWWDVPEPIVQDPRDAIVEPIVVARCDLDLYIASGVFPTPGPFAFGHEVVGRVVDLGDAVTHVSPGDIVTFPFQVSCGVCGACRGGRTNACESVPFRSSFGLAGIHGREWGGGFSDLMKVPFADHMLLKLPADCDYEQVVGASDNVADGYRAVAPGLARFPGADVLVVGGLAQSCGLYAAQAARALTKGRVLYVDTDPARLAMAAAMGVEIRQVAEGDDPADLGAFPVTVEASATQNGLSLAIGATAPSGVCTCLAGGLTPLQSIPRMDMYGRGITLEVGRAHIRPMMCEVVEHICEGRLDPKAIVGPVRDFDDAIEGMLDPAPKVIFRRRAGA